MKDKIQAAFEEIHADEALVRGTAESLNRELANRKNANKGFVFTGRAKAFSAAAAAVFIAAIFSYSLYFTPYSHVSIDVNPSVELTLNRLDKVIATRAFNEDGKRILNAVSLRGERYDKAAGLIMSLIEDEGYFANDALLSVTVQAENGNRQQTLCSALWRLIGEHVPQEAANVEVFPVSEEVWSHARGCNVSPAKYLAIQDLQEVDEEATITDYGDSTITLIRQRAQECRNAHGAASNSGEAGSGMMSGHMHGHHGGGHGSRG